MTDKKKKQQVNLSGNACIEMGMFSFSPNDPVAGRCDKYTRRGTAMQMSDGTFEFVIRMRSKSQTRLIRKLRHGRLSLTEKGDYLLTLRVSKVEGFIQQAILDDTMDAISALDEYIN